MVCRRKMGGRGVAHAFFMWCSSSARLSTSLSALASTRSVRPFVHGPSAHTAKGGHPCQRPDRAAHAPLAPLPFQASAYKTRKARNCNSAVSIMETADLPLHFPLLSNSPSTPFPSVYTQARDDMAAASLVLGLNKNDDADLVAAAPEAAAGDTLPLSSVKTAALTLAQPTVPLRIPLGEGGLTGEKKRMPEAIMGGTKSLTPNRGSNAPRRAHEPAKPSPARHASTTLSSGGRPPALSTSALRSLAPPRSASTGVGGRVMAWQQPSSTRAKPTRRIVSDRSSGLRYAAVTAVGV
mgnify:CR=1 FL=1